MKSKDDILNIGDPLKYSLIPQINCVTALSALRCTSKFFYNHDALKKHWEKMARPQIMMGQSHTLFLSANKRLWSCGSHNVYREDVSDARVFTKVVLSNLLKPNEHVVSGIAGNYHNLLLTSERLFVYGDNGYGQLGLGHHEGEFTQFTECPIVLQDHEQMKSVAAGNFYSMLLTNQRLLVCGTNDDGQIGADNLFNLYNFTEVLLEHLSLDSDETIEQIAAGETHSLFLTSKNTLCVSGDNSRKQLGIANAGRKETLFLKVDLTELLKTDESIKSIVAGYGCSLLLTSQNRLLVCGSNSHWKLGLQHVITQPTFIECPLNDVFIDGECINSVHTGGSAQTLLLTNHGRVLKNVKGEFKELDFGGHLKDKEHIVTLCATGDSIMVYTSKRKLLAQGKNLEGNLGLGDIENQPDFYPVDMSFLHSISDENQDEVINLNELFL